MGILLCEQNLWNVWIRNESVRAEIGQILHTDTHPHTHTHTTAAKLVVRISTLKSQVVLLQTAHSWANAGVLLGARMHRERGSFRNN